MMFRIHHGHYEFRIVPFGLCNALSSFQATMNDTFRPYLHKFVIVFFDDILIYNKTRTDHLQHLQQTFCALEQDQFFLKLSKCSFVQSQIQYLGHLVSTSRVEPVQDKIHAIQQWPAPWTFRVLHGFLGLIGFYRRFIKGYAIMAAPLTHLLTTPQLVWTTEAQTAFQKLKDAMSYAPTLQLLNFSVSFMVETDVSGTGMRILLSQSGHPIAFFSKQFCLRLRLASAYVQKLVAITTAIKK